MKPDIEEIKRRADAATQGPWHISGDIRHLVFPPDSYRSELPLPIIARCDGIHFADTKKHIAKIQANARFIAEARTDIPALLDYIAKLEAENERLRGILSATENDLINANMNLERMTELVEAQRWIPVTERLPEYNPTGTAKAYWVAYDTSNGKQMQIAIYSDYMYSTSTALPPCVTWRDYESHKIKNVTHWQPLPEPPKEG